MTNETIGTGIFIIFAAELHDMNETNKGFIQLHLSVMLAGFTGLFGRLITLNEVDIVWYRMVFTSAILLSVLLQTKRAWSR